MSIPIPFRDKTAPIETQLRTVLVVAADPFTTSPERLEEEVEAIRGSIKESTTVPIRIHSVHATRDDEVAEQIVATSPTIIHFTGHGSVTGQVLLESTRGMVRNVGGTTIAQWIHRSESFPESVIFNHCQVSRNRDAIAEVAGAVAFVSSVADDSLIFSRNFYAALTSQEDVRVAYLTAIADLDRRGVLRSSGTQYLEGPSGGSRPSDAPTIDVPPVAELPDERLSKLAEKYTKVLTHTLRQPTLSSSASAGRSVEPSTRVMEPRPRLEPLPDGSVRFRIWFGTNRKALNDACDTGFTTEFGDRLNVGQCTVIIPKHHTIGRIEARKWWHRFIPGKKDFMRIETCHCSEKELFLREFHDTLSAYPQGERRLLCYIHGYNTDFNEAALRTAQLGVDLKVLGETAFFSWPSAARWDKYLVDAERAEASEPFLTEFLTLLTDKIGAERIDVVAHSMGNRILIRCLNTALLKVQELTRIPFGQIFLAAPDVDSRVFKNLASVYSQSSERTTLYVSNRDLPLTVSGYMRQAPRAGYTPPITIVPAIDTIEVPRFDFDKLGHGYYAAARPIVSDMFSLINGNLPPARRVGLKSAVDPLSGSDYWIMGR